MQLIQKTLPAFTLPVHTWAINTFILWKLLTHCYMFHCVRCSNTLLATVNTHKLKSYPLQSKKKRKSNAILELHHLLHTSFNACRDADVLWLSDAVVCVVTEEQPVTLYHVLFGVLTDETCGNNKMESTCQQKTPCCYVKDIFPPH